MLKKPEGDRVKAPRVKAVVVYRDPLATPDLVASGFFSIEGHAHVRSSGRYRIQASALGVTRTVNPYRPESVHGRLQL